MKKILLTALLQLSVLSLFAQTGPGGVGNSTTNKLWLSADRQVFQNGTTTPATNNSPVEAWIDISGNSVIALQNIATYKPLLHTSIANGKSVLHFDGLDDRLLASVSSSNQLSLFVVASYDSLPIANPGLIHGATAGNAFNTNIKSVGLWVERSTTFIWGRGIQNNGTSINLPRTTPMSGNTFHSILSRYDGSTIKQFLNDQQISDTTYNGSLQSWTDFGIGRQGYESWAGDIAEIIVYNYGVNEAQRIIINNYLSAKYDIALNANNIYTMDDVVNGNYDHDVAGIGRVNATNAHAMARGSIVTIGNATSLDNNDFMFWGHDNSALSSTGVTDLPSGIASRFARVWRSSVQGNVGSVDVTFDLTGFTVNDPNDLVLLMDTDNDGVFSDEIIGSGVFYGAVNTGGSNYRFSFIPNIINATRFTLGSASSQSPLGIEDELSGAHSSLLYPNPANKSAQLTGYPQNAKVALLNVAGQEVAVQVAKSIAGDISISTEELENGLYFIKITTDSFTHTHKLIVRH